MTQQENLQDYTEHDDWIDCPYCGGQGVDESDCTCMEDCCCCLIPTPPPCNHCEGAGGWKNGD